MNTDAAQVQEEAAAPEADQAAKAGRPDAGAEEPGKGAGAPPKIPPDFNELEKAKSDFRSSFEASGNYAGQQVFVQNMNFGGAQQYKEVAAQGKAKKEARFDLKKPQDCAKFVEEYRNGEYLALAIILAVFDIVSINDLPGMAEKLIGNLPVVEERDESGNLVQPSSREPYLSLQSKLAVIGASTFVRGDGQHCVGFGSKSKQVLRNIWDQFPALRVPVISWLIEVNRSYEYKTGFDAQQMIQAFSRVIVLDFADAKKEIFPRLYSRQENKFFLGTLACALLQDPAVKDSVLPIVEGWAEPGKWLWKAALFAYAGLEDPESFGVLKGLLQKNIAGGISSFSESDVFFLALVLSRSVHARTMMCEILCRKLSGPGLEKAAKGEAADFYLMLVTYCYYRVGKESPGLFLVACDTKRQQECLSPVLKQVLSERALRKWLFRVLELYVKEVSDYQVSEQLVKHTAAYFYNMAQSAPVYREDILALLRGCSCGMASRILKLLK